MRCIVFDRSGDITRHTVEFIEQEEWPHKWEGDTIYYDILNTPNGLSRKELEKGLNIAMTTWDIEIPVKFRPAWWFTDEKADITVEFKSPDQDQLFKDQPSVLAYAYFPGQGSKSGIIVFNTAYIWTLHGRAIKAIDAKRLGLIDDYVNPDNLIKTYNIIHVLIHELGHSLGLRHDATGNRDGDDVMDPFYDGRRLDLSERDIYRIRDKYGIRIFEKWSRYDRLKRWLKIRIRRF